MDELPFRLRSLLGRVSPASFRWRRFLSGLHFDPDCHSDSLQDLSARDFIICGAPRTGTTLLSAALFQPPEVITVMEPWDGLRMPPAQLFASLRTSIAHDEGVTGGKLDLRALAAEGAVRWRTEAGNTQALAVSDDYSLGVKWPAFWRYLEWLENTRFLVCVRNPVDVIRSFRTNGGRLRQGLDYDVPFHAKMNSELARATRNYAVRRVLMFDYIQERIIPHLGRPNVHVVQYERWFTEPAALIREISSFLNVELTAGQATVRRSAPTSRV